MVNRIKPSVVNLLSSELGVGSVELAEVVFDLAALNCLYFLETHIHLGMLIQLFDGYHFDHGGGGLAALFQFLDCLVDKQRPVGFPDAFELNEVGLVVAMDLNYSYILNLPPILLHYELRYVAVGRHSQLVVLT